ncbi:MAG: LpxL/LpxP family acyltransferase [Alphaproteobacteria bacterium]
MTGKRLRKNKMLPAGKAANAVAAIKLADIGTLLGFVAITPLAWLVPRRHWHRIGCMLSPLIAGIEGMAGADAVIERVARVYRSREHAMTPRQIVARYRSGHFEEFLNVLRCYRPWRPTPDCTLTGGEHLTAALEEGRGAILWIDNVHPYSLVSKVALFQAGFKTIHLSHPSHGFSRSRFGMAVINPVKIRAEDAWLAERVFMGLDGALVALRTLRKRLRDNAVVSITAGPGAQQPVRLKFLEGEVALATGAPDLAFMAKAPLLPLHTVQRTDGSFEVSIEKPIEAERGSDRRAFSEAAALEYLGRLEPVVLSHPHQWRGWAQT